MRGSAVFRTSVTPGGALAGPWVRNPLWTAARAVPSLDLRFAENKSLVDATTGQNLVTFTRASSGTYVDSQGVIRTATTNLLLRSEEFDNASWAPTNATVTANQTIAPNGALTADQFVENVAGSARLGQVVAATPGVFYTASIYLKAGTNSIINWREDAEDVYGVAVNLATGTITGGSGTIVPVGNNWYRVSFTGSVSGTTFKPEIRTVNSPGTIFIWGAQLEQSSTVGEYIPTTSTINSAPRFDHNPTTGESLGLLVEEQRTNLCLQSEALDTSPWTSTAPYSVTANAIVSPDGTQTADALIVASGSSSFTTNVTRQVIAKAASAIQYTRTAYFKALGLTTSVRVSDFGTSAVNSASAIISLVDGSIVTAPSVAGSFTGASVAVSNAGNGWWRVAFTYTTDTATSLTIRSFPYVGAGVLTGDGSSGLYVWGAQLEAGAFPTSYIPTTTAAVTRSADVASITGSNFSSWYRQDEGTVFADSNFAASNNTRILAISDNTATNRIILSRGSGSSGNINMSVTNTTAQVSGLVFATALAAGTSNKVAAVYKASDFAGSVNGLTAATQNTGTVPSTVTQLGIGTGEVLGNNTMTGTIRRLVYFPTRLPNSTLQQITQ